MADKISPQDIAQTIKDAPGKGFIGGLKTFGGFFVPVIRVNEGTRKRTVAAAEMTDGAIQQFSQSLDKLAQEKGVTFQGIAAQDAVASQKAARDTVYDATRSFWKSALGVIFVPGLMLRGKEVMNNSAISAGDRKLSEMKILQEKLFQIAEASGIDVNDLKTQAARSVSVKTAVRDGTDDIVKSTASIVGDGMIRSAGVHIPIVSMFGAMGSTLRMTGAARDASAATAAVMDNQMAITAQTLMRIAEKEGITPDMLTQTAQDKSGANKVREAVADPGMSALASIFSGFGVVIRPKQAVGQALTAETEHQVGKLNGMTDAVESMRGSTSSKATISDKAMAAAQEKPAGADSRDMFTMSGNNTYVTSATAEAKVSNPQSKEALAPAGQSRGS